MTEGGRLECEIVKVLSCCASPYVDIIFQQYEYEDHRLFLRAKLARQEGNRFSADRN